MKYVQINNKDTRAPCSSVFVVNLEYVIDVWQGAKHASGMSLMGYIEAIGHSRLFKLRI